jgi:hypothetical protein
MIARNAAAPPIVPPITAPETEELEFGGKGVMLALTDGLDVAEGTVDDKSTFSAPKYSI